MGAKKVASRVGTNVDTSACPDVGARLDALDRVRVIIDWRALPGSEPRWSPTNRIDPRWSSSRGNVRATQNRISA